MGRTYSRKWGKLLTLFSILFLLEQTIGRLLQEAEKGCGVSGLWGVRRDLEGTAVCFAVRAHGFFFPKINSVRMAHHHNVAVAVCRGCCVTLYIYVQAIELPCETSIFWLLKFFCHLQKAHAIL